MNGRTREDGLLSPGLLLQGRRGRRLGRVRWLHAASIGARILLTVSGNVQFLHSVELQVLLQLSPAHAGGFDRATVVLAQPFEVLPSQSPDFNGRPLLAETAGQILNRDSAMAGIDPISQATS